MQTASSVKAGVAFLAGIIVALGGAVVYFKASDAHVRPAIQAATLGDSASSVPDLSTSPPKPHDPAPSQPATPQPKTQPAVTAKPAANTKPVFTKPRVTSRPISLATSRPPRPPVLETVAENLPVPPQDPPPADSEPAPVISQPAPVPPPQPEPHTVTIPAGTSIAVRLNEKLSTDHNFGGDTFRATLDAPIVMDGFIIADRGAKVLGRIVKAQKPGKLEGMAELSLTLTEISTTDGQRMHVETNESLRKGLSNTNEEVLKMGGGAALGAIIGALAGGGKGAVIGAGAGGAAGTGAVLLGRGKPAVIDNETRLTFALANPTTITEQLN